GQQSVLVELRDGKQNSLPVAVRCDGAGQENYADGTPKKWWSQLAVVRNGQDLQRKEIVVNDPLVYGGVRFYQASYGPTGKLEKLLLTARASSGPGENKDLALGLDASASLDPATTVQFEAFIPDHVFTDGERYPCFT